MIRLKVKRKMILRVDARNVGVWLMVVLLTLPHMKPAYFAQIPQIDLVFDILRGGSFGLIALWYILRRRPISLVIVLTAAWRALLVFSTIISKGEVYSCIVTSFSILSVMLLYDAAYRSERTTFISAQLFCFELILYINLLTEILFPKGLYTTVTTIVHDNNWFIGYYNNHSQFFIPALMFAWLYRDRTGKWLRPVLLTAVIYVSAFLVWSGGVLLSLACMTLVYLLFKNRTRILNYYTYWLTHIVFFFGVFVLRIQDWFHWLLEDVLGKASSLNFRINLWGRTLELIAKSPLIGYGSQTVYVRAAEVDLVHGIHAHNMLLELLYQGGIIGLVLWIGIVIVAGRRLMKYGYTQESKIISIAFLGWCIATLVEPFTTPFLMGMFVIAYRSSWGEAVLQGSAAAGSRWKQPRRRGHIRICLR